MLILLYMAYLAWERAQIDKDAAKASHLEDPIVLNAKGQPVLDPATGTARRRPHDQKLAVAALEAAHAKRASGSKKALLAVLMIWCVVYASSLGADAELVASTATRAECAGFLTTDALQACLAPVHALFIGAAGESASLEVLSWAVLIL